MLEGRGGGPLALHEERSWCRSDVCTRRLAAALGGSASDVFSLRLINGSPHASKRSKTSLPLIYEWEIRKQCAEGGLNHPQTPASCTKAQQGTVTRSHEDHKRVHHALTSLPATQGITLFSTAHAIGRLRCSRAAAAVRTRRRLQATSFSKRLHRHAGT